MTTAPLDHLRRPLGTLRLSVTDRCNLRCRYCMPEQDYVWLPRASLLTFEGLARVARVFSGLGVTKIRITGGEPLLRQDLATLIGLLAATAGIHDLALTTNGVLLASHAATLRAAGLRRVTISLDTLRADRMRSFARSTRHGDVLAGIAAARAAGLQPVKLNTVVVRGFNDDELEDLVEFARRFDAEPRFIEYMDVGGATRWSPADVVGRAEILARLGRRYGQLEPAGAPDAAAPAARFRLPDGMVVGVVASTTAPFCATCDRVRLTADGTMFPCLYAETGIDLRTPLRRGASDTDLAALVAAMWRGRRDRGAEERLGITGREPLYALAGLRADPHREMHTRGG